MLWQKNCTHNRLFLNYAICVFPALNEKTPFLWKCLFDSQTDAVSMLINVFMYACVAEGHKHWELAFEWTHACEHHNWCCHFNGVWKSAVNLLSVPTANPIFNTPTRWVQAIRWEWLLAINPSLPYPPPPPPLPGARCTTGNENFTFRHIISGKLQRVYFLVRQPRLYVDKQPETSEWYGLFKTRKKKKHE